MIKCIVAIDSKRGMANEKGIPWSLPTDLEYYRSKTLNGAILMGYQTYKEFDKPFHDRLNYVAVPDKVQMRPGFEQVKDPRDFLRQYSGDIWVIGGAGLIASTLDLIEELYITRIDHDFNCTKFFPEFESKFKLQSRSEPVHENGVTFRFEVWKKD